MLWCISSCCLKMTTKMNDANQEIMPNPHDMWRMYVVGL